MYRIIDKSKLWVSISAILLIASIVLVSVWGLKPGIDFTGGSMIELKMTENRPTGLQLSDTLKDLKLGSLSVQPTNSGFILRFQESGEPIHQQVLAKVGSLGKYEEISFTSIGPSIGKELQRKAITAIILVLIAISTYIAIAFRKVSKPVASWKYGIATLIALFHDAIIVVGVYAILGKFFGVEVGTSFVVAVLTVIGFSVHDTIVVFDRIRENLPKSNKNFKETVNDSVNQTLHRSINTSLTVIITLLCVFFFGGESTKFFSLSLAIGIFFGTYSSIFLASPVLVFWQEYKKTE